MKRSKKTTGEETVGENVEETTGEETPGQNVQETTREDMGKSK